MKIGTKQIILFVFAAALILVGYKHTEIIGFFSGDTAPTQSSGPSATPTGTDDVDAFVPSGLYFSNNRLERDTVRSQTKETLENITADANATAEVKSEAYEKIIEIGDFAQIETTIEGLIREKGFDDAYACFNDIGEIDILVKAATLEEDQVVQITDIIKRHSDLDYKDIHVRKVA